MIQNLFYGVLLILYYLYYSVILIIHYFCIFLTVLIVIKIIVLRRRGHYIVFGSSSRRCGKPGCSGFKNCYRLTYQEQTEECLKLGGKDVEKVDNLPVKKASEKDKYAIEYLMADLKEFAPVNGRAVYLFRDKCGCHIAKLEAWGKKERYISKKDELCCICLSKYSNNAELMQLPCSHFYHKNCINRWIETKNQCPLCRAKFDTDVLRNQIKLLWRDPKTLYWRRIAEYVTYVSWFEIIVFIWMIWIVNFFYTCFRYMCSIVS